MNQRIKNYHRKIAWLVIVAMQHLTVAPALAAPNLPVPDPVKGSHYTQSGVVTSVKPPDYYQISGNTGTVNQTASKQVFNWTSFDIGNGYKVVFSQPKNGIALNRVTGTDMRPSEIRGALEAKGTVYLINQNGIIFGSTAQVNVGSLIASQLNMSDSNFENYSLGEIMGKLGQPAFEVFTDSNHNPILHEINIENGAKIHSNTLDGVKIFAPVINNDGTIETPDGQAMLVASKGKVYLTEAVTPGNVTPQLAGFLVEVDTGGNVNNVGNIIAERGNITLMGMAINQDGRLTATTAAGQSSNGSIRLLARDHADQKLIGQSIYGSNSDSNKLARGPLIGLLYGSDTQLTAQSSCAGGQVCTGTVTFGKNSVTEVLPDNSSAPQPNSVVQNPSVVEVMGKNIELQDNALIHATGGVVQITATTASDNPIAGGEPGATVTIGSGAKIDVSGASVDKSVQDNVVSAKLVGTNLADVPVQQTDALNRADVLVDARLGTNVANVTGEIGAMTHSASERLTAGGSVKISSGDSVTIDPNATVDISGGKINYAGGDKTTTYLHGGGRWTEISQANPLVTYDAIRNVTTHNAPGYVEGANAGSVEISTNSAPALAANVIKAGVTPGVYQRDENTAPKPGTLTLNLMKGQDQFSTNTVNIVTQQAYQNIVGQIVDQLFANSGLGSFTLNTGGDVNIKKGSNIHLADGGKFTVNTNTDQNTEPAAINIDGTIRIAGGSVALDNQKSNGQLNNAITIGSGASIDTSGLWINEFVDRKTMTSHFIDGGNIDLKAGSLILQSGSALIANGGALYDGKAKLTAGSGGSISLATNYVNVTPSNKLDAAQLQLGATMSAYSLSQGGTLSLTHNGFVIGTAGTQINATDLLLMPDYFRRGGFSNFNLTSTLDGIRVASNTQVNLRSDNWVLPNRKLLTQKTGADMSAFVAAETLPDYLRKPTNLSLTVLSQPILSGLQNSLAAPLLSIGTGASIIGDPGANVSLDSQALQILIDGAIRNPGGNIVVSLDGATTNHVDYSSDYNADQAIVLGSNALLDSSATFVAKPQISHSSFRDYITYDAGKISLNANHGYIVTEKGSQLRVDGAAQQMDVKQYSSGGRTALVDTSVAANAGTLHLQAAEGMLLDGNMSGKAANVVGAMGGRLEVVLDTNLTLSPARLDQLNPNKPLASTIHLDQASLDNIPAGLVLHDAAGQLSGIGDIRAAINTSSLNVKNNSVVLSADNIASGGFDSLLLEASNTRAYSAGSALNTPQQLGSIAIDSNVNLSLRESLELNTNTLAINNGSTAILSANYLSWGSDKNPNDAFRRAAKNATAGDGTLILAGSFIDLIGKLTTQGTKQTSLQSNGDIRARDILNNDTTTVISEGSLTTAGNLTLQAQQIYPPSAHHFVFNVNSSDPDATLTILPQAGTPGAVLSAGGSLTFNAPNIEQDGVVKAPLGSITMNAAHKLTLGASSATSILLDTQVPYGIVDNNGKWQIALPEKKIVLNAPDQTIAKGAVIDISGAVVKIEDQHYHDVYEYQFIAGPGGSKDVLANPGSSFAIVPTLSLAYAPLDSLDASMVAPTGWSPGQVVSLAINGGVQNYTVLPARYAMLPGALLVAPDSKYNGLAPGSNFTLNDGTQIVAGKIGYAPQGSNNTPLIQDSKWSAFALLTRDQVFHRSEYRLQYGSGLSEDTSTSNLPQDAATLQILAQTSAIFAGELRAAGADGGHGGKLDIQANDISVVKAPTPPGAHSGLELLDSQLNAMTSVESIFLGGRRTNTDTGTQLSVAANTINIAENVALNVKELMLGVKDKIAVAANAVISASGAQNPRSDAETINVSGDGAILRLSSVNQANIQRTGASTASTQGTIALDSSAQLHATKAIAVDVTKGANLAGVMDANGGSLAFSAPQISIGGGNSGLLLRSDQLRNINDASHPDLQQLILNSSSNLDFYSGLRVSADDLQIGAANIRSFAGANDIVQLNANKTLTLTGRGSAANASAGNNGQLSITAPQIILKGGANTQQTLSLNNFNNQTTLNASNSVIAQNKLAMATGGAVNIVTPLLTSSDGAELALQSNDAVSITGGNGASQTAAGNFGSVAIDAKTAHIDTAVVLPSGRFTVTANGDTGTDAIIIGDNVADATHDHAVIDVSGRTITIGDQIVETDGGAVNFVVNNGNVRATANSVLKTSAGGNNTDAGSVNISAAQGSAQIDAQLLGNAAANHNGGSFAVDAQTINGFSNLLQRLGTGGFNNSIAIRQRSGDLALDAQDNVRAHQIDIETDSGNLNIGGTLDASGGSGGSILLAAGSDLNLLGTAKINAYATDANGDGGDVTLISRDGFMNLADGSSISVGGNGTGKNGSVTLEVSRTKDGVITHTANDGLGDDGANGLAITHFGAQVNGARTIDLVGMRHYLASKVSDVITAVKEQLVDPFSLSPLYEDYFTHETTTDPVTYDDQGLPHNNAPIMIVAEWHGAVDDTRAFMDRSVTWAQQLFGNSVPVNVRVMPGVDIYSKGNLVVDQMIDLFDNGSGLWRYGNNADIPGVLSLRAVGNVNIDKPVSDGFISFLSFMNPQLTNLYGSSTCDTSVNCSGLATGASWAINVTAGADLSAATPYAVSKQNNGSVVLGPTTLVANQFYDGSFDTNATIEMPTVVRTGTGDIQVHAASDVVLQDNHAAIYTAGVITPFAQRVDGSDTQMTSGYSYDFIGGLFQGNLPEFPIDGGNVSVSAGGSIAVQGVTQPNQSSDWLLRIGDDTHPVAWGIAPLQFGGGIGALAGGNVSVLAGKDISYVQIAAPTIGKQTGNILFNEQLIDETGAITNVSKIKPDAADFAQVTVYGGGDVSVNAGGNIASSSIFAAKGSAMINAGGAVTKASGATVGTLIGIGDTQLTIKAQGSIAADAIYNPTTFFTADSQPRTVFITYTPNTSISLFSRTGDIAFNNNMSALKTAYGLTDSPSTNQQIFSALLPSNMRAVAATGNITMGSLSVTLLPSAQSSLALIAGNDVQADEISRSGFVLPDGDPIDLPMLNPTDTAGVYTLIPYNLSSESAQTQQEAPLTETAHAGVSLHLHDNGPETIISVGNDLSNFSLVSWKAADISAGRDIVDSHFLIQNLHESDVSQISAGRDILYSGINTSNLNIQVSGPGRLDILAGRDVDLGNSTNGVKSIGGNDNPALSDEPAATISVLAGLGSVGLNYDGFIKKYILGTDALLNYVTSARFGGDVISYVSAATGTNYADRNAAITALQNLANASAIGKTQAFSISRDIYLSATRAQQRELVMNTYFSEIKEGGIEGTNKTGEGYARAYTAIDTLFPDASAATKKAALTGVGSTSTAYAGDIRLTQSVIQGFGDGDINLIAPGGSIDVGLPVAANQVDQTIVQGIVVSGKGSINAYVRDDINVNRSRVIVQDGGNILGFARFGNIDAGRGSRTKITSPPPRLEVINGSLQLVSQAALSGSGIQAGCTSADCKGGDVELFAPNGIIDAGDAGISSKGNIIIGGLLVLHTDVINAGGTVSGVPAAPLSPLNLGGGDVAASATQSAQQAAVAAATGEQKLDQGGVALLTVDILDYGSSHEDDKSKEQR